MNSTLSRKSDWIMYPRLRSDSVPRRDTLRTLGLTRSFWLFTHPPHCRCGNHRSECFSSAPDHLTMKLLLAMTNLVVRSMEIEPFTGITSAATTYKRGIATPFRKNQTSGAKTVYC